MSLRTTPETRFDSFEVSKTSYKRIGSHEIEVNVLVPKSIKSGKCPIVMKWPRRFTGTALYAPWFAAYLVPFLTRNNAIAILPNYRLTPEHSGNNIVSNIADFHRRFRDTLPSYLSIEHPEIEVDFERVLVQGDSAGSWCALQSIMTQPRGTFKACFLQYLVVCAFPTSTDDRLMGQEIPPKEALDEFLASITQGTVMSSVTPPARKWVAPMLRAHGLWKHYFGEVFGC